VAFVLRRVAITERHVEDIPTPVVPSISISRSISLRGLRDSMLGRGAAIDEVVPSVGSGRGNEVSRDGRDA
jgi:hypothetical protein